MKKYMAPEMKLRLFDENKIVVTDSEYTLATYSDKLLQQFTFGDEKGHGSGVGVGSSVSVKLQDIDSASK